MADQGDGVFRVAVTPDLVRPDGTLGRGSVLFPVPASDAGLKWESTPRPPNQPAPGQSRSALDAGQIRGYDGLLLLAPSVTEATLEGADRLSVVARFGVGYDTVDVDACTRHGVLLTITPDGVRRPVASSALAFMLALAHRMPIRDRLIRTGGWSESRDEIGVGLAGRTLGLIGLGNIGREVMRLVAPFGMTHLVSDPFVSPQQATEAGASLADLNTLLRTADFVVITCPLNKETFHLISTSQLALMKPTAFLINVARGPIVDQQAVTATLRDGRIRGAALDVFEEEPIDPNDPLLTMDNVILAPHTICWTDECVLGNFGSAWESIVDVAAGRMPKYVVNRDALNHPRLKETLERNRARTAATGP